MPTSSITKAISRRFAADARSESQLAWLQRVAVLSIDKRPPSYSQLLRRAVGLLVEHTATMIEAGRLDGLPGPHPQDADAERAALADHSRIIPADTPHSMVDAQGRLKVWLESTVAPTALATTTRSV